MAPERWLIPTSDDEIVDVFLEEVGEIVENIDNQLNKWKNSIGDREALTEIRRSFHTLKGSGRMVRAIDLSEIAWRIERMLNQVIGEVVPASEPMVKLVVAVRAQIPRMVDAFKNRRSMEEDEDIERLMAQADSLAAGKKPGHEPAARAGGGAAAPDKPSPQLHDLNLKLEHCMQRTDEALHRSEMALQQARRASAAPSTAAQKATGQQVRSVELDRIEERLSQLSKDVSDLRLQSTKTRRELSQRQNEMSARVAQRVRARMAPMDRLRGEIEQDLEESRRTVASVRRFGWLALILSAVIGGVVATGLLTSFPSLG